MTVVQTRLAAAATVYNTSEAFSITIIFHLCDKRLHFPFALFLVAQKLLLNILIMSQNRLCDN